MVEFNSRIILPWLSHFSSGKPQDLVRFEVPISISIAMLSKAGADVITAKEQAGYAEISTTSWLDKLYSKKEAKEYAGGAVCRVFTARLSRSRIVFFGEGRTPNLREASGQH